MEWYAFGVPQQKGKCEQHAGSAKRKRLLRFAHVSLDSLSLAGIRNCIDDPEIPPKAAMRFVAGPTMYRQIQEVIRRIAKRAGVPAIYYDVLVWNLQA